jgi:threonine-phosphate decarboxylase
VILRSLTKFFALPGLRLGYALGPTAVIARLAAQVPPWSVGTLAQAAGLAALADPAYRERTRQLIAEERCWLALQLAELPALQVYPAAANYLLVEMTTGLPAAVLRDRLLAERILIRECSTFVGLDNRFFRVAVRSRAENGRLVAALQRHLVS